MKIQAPIEKVIIKLRCDNEKCLARPVVLIQPPDHFFANAFACAYCAVTMSQIIFKPVDR